jgi:hypothetical protein
LLKQLAQSSATNDYLLPWLKYQIARLNLQMNYDNETARETLADIVNSRPGTPLSVQAQELLTVSRE